MAFKVGQRVETIDYAPPFRKSFYTGTVVEFNHGRVTVRYETLKDFYGEPLVDNIEENDVRPVAPEVDVDIEEQSTVNAWDGKGWRWGKCIRKVDDLYTVEFRSESDAGNAKIAVFGKEHLRIHQEWDMFQGSRWWVYLKNERVEFGIGNRVEIVGFESGMENSYYAGTIVGFSRKARVKVRYETLTQDNGQPLTEDFTRSDIRPYPPGVNVNVCVGDVVDVWDNHGWWMGRCTAFNTRTGEYTVFFDYVDEPEKKERKYEIDDVRIHQDWWPINCSRFWSYNKV